MLEAFLRCCHCEQCLEYTKLDSRSRHIGICPSELTSLNIDSFFFANRHVDRVWYDSLCRSWICYMLSRPIIYTYIYYMLYIYYPYIAHSSSGKGKQGKLHIATRVQTFKSSLQICISSIYFTHFSTFHIHVLIQKP